MSKNSITVIKDDRKKLDRYLSEIEIFKRSYVKVGVLEGTKRRKSGRHAIMMAMLAAVHEYGSAKRKIPERSFIRSWVDNNKTDIKQTISKLYTLVCDGKINANTALKRLGAYGTGGIKARIREIKTPPLKPRTIARKGSTQPLIDTGQLRNGIHYKVEKK